MQTIAAPVARHFFGSRVVRAAFVLAIFGWGVGFYGPPVFLHAVVQRTGWSLALASAAVTLHFLCGTLVIVNLPRLHQRVGVARTIILGSVVTSVGVCGWAIASEPWHLFAAALVSGAGWVTMGAVAVNAVISPWFVRTRPKALATAYNGASIGGVIFSPLWVALIQSTGFAWAASAVGVTMVVVLGWIAVRIFAIAPESLGQLPDGDSPVTAARRSTEVEARALPGKRLWRDRAFLTLAAGMATGLFAQIGLVAHLFSLMAPALGGQAAGLAMGGATACAILGRAIAARLLMRNADRRHVAAGAYGIQALGSLLLLLADQERTGLILLGVLLFGSGIGNATSLPPLIAQTDFPERDVSRVVALIVAIGQGTYAFAPALFGLLLVTIGAGRGTGIGAQSVLFFATAAGIQSVAAVCLLVGRRKG
jgi:MFS family permease